MVKSRVTLTIMFLMLSTLACGLIDDVLEPGATLAPPPTTDGIAPTVTTPAGGVATGDAGLATPTLAVSPTPGAATIEELGEPPETLPELADWIARAHSAAVDIEDLCAVLSSAQWRQPEDSCEAADLDGDEQEEWLLTIDFSRLQEEPPLIPPEGHPGDFWVVSDGSVVHQTADADEPDFFASAPQLVELTDMTGDEQPDAVTVFTTCGAHTCYYYYQIIGAHGGAIRNLVQLSEEQLASEEALPEFITMEYVDSEEVRDANEDELPDLVIHGGIVGSAGAGLQRARTEVWSWDGEAITLSDLEWDETNVRVHWLYNANYDFQEEAYDRARMRYEAVIVNAGLEDIEGLAGSAQEVRDAAQQFAAFRLSLLPLMRGDITESTRWRNWLQEQYADAPISNAAQRLFTEWESNGNNLAAACSAVGQYLATTSNPTGPLTDMGYNNPSLTAETVCPIE